MKSVSVGTCQICHIIRCQISQSPVYSKRKAFCVSYIKKMVFCVKYIKKTALYASYAKIKSIWCFIYKES